MEKTGSKLSAAIFSNKKLDKSWKPIRSHIKAGPLLVHQNLHEGKNQKMMWTSDR